MKQVRINLISTSQLLVIDNVTNTFQKGDLYCIFVHNENKIHKIPVRNIVRIVEVVPDEELYQLDS